MLFLYTCIDDPNNKNVHENVKTFFLSYHYNVFNVLQDTMLCSNTHAPDRAIGVNYKLY